MFVAVHVPGINLAKTPNSPPPLKGTVQQEKIFDLQFVLSFEPNWATDKWVWGLRGVNKCSFPRTLSKNANCSPLLVE